MSGEQPFYFYDCLIRTDGQQDLRATEQGAFGALQNRTQLLVRRGADLAVSNVPATEAPLADAPPNRPPNRIEALLENCNLYVTRFDVVARFAKPSSQPRLPLLERLEWLLRTQAHWIIRADERSRCVELDGPISWGSEWKSDHHEALCVRGRMIFDEPIDVREHLSVIATAVGYGPTAGSSLVEHLNGLVFEGNHWKPGADQIEKEIRVELRGYAELRPPRASP